MTVSPLPVMNSVIAKDNSPTRPIVVPKIVDGKQTNPALPGVAQYLNGSDAHGLPFFGEVTRLVPECEDAWRSQGVTHEMVWQVL